MCFSRWSKRLVRIVAEWWILSVVVGPGTLWDPLRPLDYLPRSGAYPVATAYILYVYVEMGYVNGTHDTL